MFEKLRKPDIQQMSKLVIEKFGSDTLLSDALSAFLRKHHWFLDDYMRELTMYYVRYGDTK